MQQTKRLKTPEQARAEFERRGLSIAAWAGQNGVHANLVYEILAGNPRRRCLRGQSHRVAVLLGLKAGELGGSPNASNDGSPSVKPTRRAA